MSRPFHLHVEEGYYFLTARTQQGYPFLHSQNAKRILLGSIEQSVQQCTIKLFAWVIMDNHYHILIGTDRGQRIQQLMQLIHGRSSRRLRKFNQTEGRLISLPSTGWKVWQNYWDICIRDEADFFTHLNYIHHNPVKHGLVRRMEDYPFSSYRQYVQTEGSQWLDSSFETYPVIDFT